MALAYEYLILLWYFLLLMGVGAQVLSSAAQRVSKRLSVEILSGNGSLLCECTDIWKLPWHRTT